MAIKDESSDDDYKSAKSGKERRIKQNNYVEDDLDSEAEEQIDINKAAEEIFNQDESVRSLDPRKNRRL